MPYVITLLFMNVLRFSYSSYRHLHFLINLAQNTGRGFHQKHDNQDGKQMASDICEDMYALERISMTPSRIPPMKDPEWILMLRIQPQQRP